MVNSVHIVMNDVWGQEQTMDRLTSTLTDISSSIKSHTRDVIHVLSWTPQRGNLDCRKSQTKHLKLLLKPSKHESRVGI